MRTSDLTAVTDLAAGQWGLLTTAQAQQAGVSRVQLTRMVTAGVLERVAHGVYATPAVLGDDLLSLRTAWLILQPRASASDRLADPIAAGVVSHTSAAYLHQLGDLLADEHELTLPQRYQSTRAGIRVHRSLLTADEVTLAAGLPVTTPARTVADLLTAGHDLDHVAHVAADAVRRGSATPRDLATVLQPIAARQGAADGGALTQQLLDAGGLAPHERPGYDIRLASRLELLRRSLEESGMRSPDARINGDDNTNSHIDSDVDSNASSNVAAVAMGIITLATLVEEVAADPHVRAAAARFTQRTRANLTPLRNQLVHGVTPAVRGARARLGAALPSPSTRERILDWFAEPTNQAAVTQLLTTLQAHASGLALEDFPTTSTGSADEYEDGRGGDRERLDARRMGGGRRLGDGIDAGVDIDPGADADIGDCGGAGSAADPGAGGRAGSPTDDGQEQ